MNWWIDESIWPGPSDDDDVIGWLSVGDNKIPVYGYQFTMLPNGGLVNTKPITIPTNNTLVFTPSTFTVDFTD